MTLLRGREEGREEGGVDNGEYDNAKYVKQTTLNSAAYINNN